MYMQVQIDAPRDDAFFSDYFRARKIDSTPKGVSLIDKLLCAGKYGTLQIRQVG